MVEMDHHQIGGGQARGERHEMEQSQGIQSPGNAHQNSVARLNEPPPYDVVPKVQSEPEGRAQGVSPCDTGGGTRPARISPWDVPV